MTTQKTILLAEDDAEHEALIREAVAKSGIACRVDVVRDGAEALEYLFAVGSHQDRDPRHVPDLILLDLVMPRMDGLQFMQVLRRVRGTDQIRFAPLVVLSSSDADGHVAEAYRRGAQSYIIKPTEPDEFADVIQEVVWYWLKLNHPLPTTRSGPWSFHEGL